MTFLDTLRSLDKAATPGPWRVTTATWDGTEYTTIRCDSGADVLTEPVTFSAYESGAFITPEGLKSDAEIAVALRNAAPRIAALVEAVGAYRDARFAGDSAVASGSTAGYADSIRAIPDAYHAMLDTLAALEAP